MNDPELHRLAQRAVKALERIADALEADEAAGWDRLGRAIARTVGVDPSRIEADHPDHLSTEDALRGRVIASCREGSLSAAECDAELLRAGFAPLTPDEADQYR